MDLSARLRAAGLGLARAASQTTPGERLRREAHRFVVSVVLDDLHLRREAVVESRATHADARRRLPGIRTRLGELAARLDRTPFHGGMTVHAAHGRHPGVRAAFAARGLPGCLDCAVGADETLAEAAFGELFDLDTLLAELERGGPAA